MNNIICIIEDNHPVRKLFSILLKKEGLSVIEFEDGNTAYEWLKENKPRAVIMDILLPDFHGSELLQEIRKLPHGNIPVIAVTGFAQPAERNKYLQMGFDQYILKPVNTDTFAKDINSILN